MKKKKEKKKEKKKSFAVPSVTQEFRRD